MKTWKEYLDDLPLQQRTELASCLSEMGIDDKDALFPVLVYMEYYKTFLDEWPNRTRAILECFLENARLTAIAEVEVSLSKTIAEAAEKMTKRSISALRAKWYSLAAISTLFVLLGGFYIGMQYSYSDVEMLRQRREIIARNAEVFVAEKILKDEDKILANWAFSEEGRSAFKKR